MARRPSKHLRPPRPLDPNLGTSAQRLDGRWIVRTVPGAAAAKAYRCPGCAQTIPPGTPHVVVWSAEPGLTGAAGVEERRHWHRGCWERRR